MTNRPRDKEPNVQEIVTLITDAVNKLRKHNGQFVSALALLERAIVEIYQNLEPPA